MKLRPPTTAPYLSDDAVGSAKAADLFRPLEDSEALAVQAWVQEQQARTRGFLDSLAGRREIEEQFRSVRAAPRFGVPIRRGGRSFYTYHDGKRPQAVWMVEDEAGERVLIDPVTWFGRDTDYTGAFEPSASGLYVAYTRHLSGSGYSTLHVHDVERGVDLPETLGRCRLGFPAWSADDRAFLYSQVSVEAAGPSTAQSREEVRIHHLHRPISEDKTVFVPPAPGLRFAWSKSLPDDSGFVCYADSGDTRYGAWIVDQKGADLRQLVEAGLCSFAIVHKEGNTVYALTDHLAPRKRVVALDLLDSAFERWRTVVPETESVIDWATFVAGHWLLCLSEHGWSRIQIRRADGSALRYPALPEPAVFSWPKSRPEDACVDLAVHSLTMQGTLYSIDIRNNSATVLRPLNVANMLADCVCFQVFVTARDGVRIPLTLLHPRDLVRDGATPTLLYGYGAFGRPATHGFSSTTLAWVRSGGVYAIAHTRGGAEEGEAWHEAAVGRLRHVAHEDFSDCAEWLISEGYCKPSTLGIHGTSAGGLLIATAAVQRPELFGAAVCHAAPTDMVRFPKFTLGGAWIKEFGNPDDPDDLSAILAWSPLHNIRRDVTYPAMLISTGARDELVAPVHSFKFAAALQRTPSPIVLLRVQEDAGHAVANSSEQILKLMVDQHVFLWFILTSNR